MPCTRKTTRCSDARDYKRELAECCRGYVVQIMSDVSRALTGAGITWWADYGTLLGAVRNPQTTWADYPWLPQDGRTSAGPLPGIVPHDKDGDIGALWTDWNKYRGLRLSLEKKGYSVTLNSLRGASKVLLSVRNHTNVDVFFWRMKRTGVMYRVGYAQVDQFKGREFSADFLVGMGTVPWEGLQLPAPSNPEAFLEMRYGPNWRVPVAANNDGVMR